MAMFLQPGSRCCASENFFRPAGLADRLIVVLALMLSGVALLASCMSGNEQARRVVEIEAAFMGDQWLVRPAGATGARGWETIGDFFDQDADEVAAVVTFRKKISDENRLKLEDELAIYGVRVEEVIMPRSMRVPDGSDALTENPVIVRK
ncbi:hypothetical protein H5P28_18965 [Ruficoccus amylovorans]|uniref:Uncharacterized protein n=1 Tax=Ruficoccus amylovorans TaxID=1804625 RepID=A0A842HKZ5_9BACT|nr:hypothetical protein [Ruficoccus amylovorans]MBC2596354.1 hypothetical protein [Ruficoccus amylovorans]